MSGTRIGELNGRWAALLKITLVAVPVIASLFTASFVPWAVWVTGNIYMSRQTAVIVQDMSAKMQSFDTRFNALPPEEWKERIRKLEEWVSESRADRAEIKTALAEIKTEIRLKWNTHQAPDELK